MTLRRISVDVIGCGEIAQIMHLRHLFELSDRFTVRAICDRDPDVLKGVADRWGVTTTYTEYRDMLAETTADALLVLSSGDHTEMIHAGLDNGMDIFVEKPLCFSTEDARAIARRAEESGRTVMVGYSRLFDTAFTDLQRALREETGPLYIRAEAILPWDYYYIAHHDVVRPADWNPPMTAPSWGGSWDYFYRDVLFNLVIHEIYCLRELTGITEPRIVASTEVLDRRGVEVSWQAGDDVHVSMGVLTSETIAGGYTEEFRVASNARTHLLSYPSVYLRNQPATLTRTELVGDRLVRSETTGSYVDPFEAELLHFSDVVSGERSCVSTAAHAVDDIRTLNQIFELARDRREPA